MPFEITLSTARSALPCVRPYSPQSADPDTELKQVDSDVAGKGFSRVVMTSLMDARDVQANSFHGAVFTEPA